jgi:hypothetical protein
MSGLPLTATERRDSKTSAMGQECHFALPQTRPSRDHSVNCSITSSAIAITPATACRHEPLVIFQFDRQLSGWNLPPLMIRGIGKDPCFIFLSSGGSVVIGR